VVVGRAEVAERVLVRGDPRNLVIHLSSRFTQVYAHLHGTGHSVDGRGQCRWDGYSQVLDGRHEVSQPFDTLPRLCDGLGVGRGITFGGQRRTDSEEATEKGAGQKNRFWEPRNNMHRKLLKTPARYRSRCERSNCKAVPGCVRWFCN